MFHFEMEFGRKKAAHSFSNQFNMLPVFRLTMSTSFNFDFTRNGLVPNFPDSLWIEAMLVFAWICPNKIAK